MVKILLITKDDEMLTENEYNQIVAGIDLATTDGDGDGENVVNAEKIKSFLKTFVEDKSKIFRPWL